MFPEEHPILFSIQANFYPDNHPGLSREFAFEHVMRQKLKSSKFLYIGDSSKALKLSGTLPPHFEFYNRFFDSKHDYGHLCQYKVSRLTV